MFIVQIMGNVHATPPHLDVFQILVLGEVRGDVGFFALYACGCQGWLLPGGISYPDRFVEPGLHFESFVALWDEAGIPGARHGEKFEKHKDDMGA